MWIKFYIHISTVKMDKKEQIASIKVIMLLLTYLNVYRVIQQNHGGLLKKSVYDNECGPG